MKTTGESFQMTSGSVQGVQEREQDIWKKVCELICRGVKLSENSQSRIISKCNACKNSKTTTERAVKTL